MNYFYYIGSSSAKENGGNIKILDTLIAALFTHSCNVKATSCNPANSLSELAFLTRPKCSDMMYASSDACITIANDDDGTMDATDYQLNIMPSAMDTALDTLVY
eukprot:4427894-Pyramimonas_sp.AAC.2